MHIETTTPGAVREWDDFVNAHPRGTLYHQKTWQDVSGKVFGHPNEHFIARNKAGVLCGVLSVIRLRSPLFGHFGVSLPYVNFGGALGDSEHEESALMAAAIESLQKAGVSHVEFRDSVQRDSDLPHRTDKVCMELPLPESEEAFLSAIGSKLRSQAKRAMREGATIRHGGLELVPAFYEVFARNMRDLGTPVYSPRLFKETANAFPEQARVSVVFVENEPAAAGFTLDFKHRTEIPWASALRKFNRLSVNMMLYAEIIKDAIRRGQHVFDFGRSTIDAGTYRFKKQWGAHPNQLYWYYWLKHGTSLPSLNPDNPKYALAIKAWRKLPLPIANSLGPHIVRFLP